jgi:hypothetical protein
MPEAAFRRELQLVNRLGCKSSDPLVSQKPLIAAAIVMGSAGLGFCPCSINSYLRSTRRAFVVAFSQERVPALSRCILSLICQ